MSEEQQTAKADSPPIPQRLREISERAQAGLNHGDVAALAAELDEIADELEAQAKPAENPHNG